MKRYVDVVTYIAADGRRRPMMVCQEEGRYPIDRVLSVRRLFAADGGCGICYTCQVGNSQRFLYWDRTRWFVSDEGPARPQEGEDSRQICQ